MAQAPRYFQQIEGPPGREGEEGDKGHPPGSNPPWRLYLMGDHPQAIPGETYSDPSVGDGWLAMGDAYLSQRTGGTVNGPTIFTDTVKAPAPTLFDDVATKEYVDSVSSGAGSGDYLPLTGGTLTGSLDLDADPYSGSLVAGWLEPWGPGLHLYSDSSAVNIYSNSDSVYIHNLAEPTSPDDAATKSYVDANAGGGAAVPGSPVIRTPFAKRDTDKVTILVLGDSLTEGVGGVTAFTNTWQQRMAQGMRNRLGIGPGGPGWQKPRMTDTYGFTEGVIVGGTPVDGMWTGIPGALSDCSVRWDTPGATSVDVWIHDENGGGTTTITPATGSPITVGPGQPPGEWKRTVTNPGATLTVTSDRVMLGICQHQGDEDSGVEIIGWGWAGSRTIEHLWMLDQPVLRHFLPMLAPDIVAVYLGANDAHNGGTPAEITANLKEIVSEVQTLVPKCTAFLVNYYDADGAWDGAIEDWAPYDAAIRQAADDLGVPLVDVIGMPHVADDPDLYYADGLHFTDSGERWVGDMATDTIAVGGGLDLLPSGGGSTGASDVGDPVWEFWTNTDAVLPGEIKFSGGDTLRVHLTDKNGIRRKAEMAALAVGDKVYLRNSGGYYEVVLATITDNTDYYTLTLSAMTDSLGVIADGSRAFVETVHVSKQYVDSRVGGGGPPTGTAGGDLSGTYPSPQIATGVIVNADINASAAIATSKISGLDASLTAKEATANKGAASGYASLDSSTKVPIAQVPTGTTGTTVALGNHNHDTAYAALAHTHTQAQSHNTPDTDSAPTALHHTIGTGANQAAAGNHLHTGVYDPAGTAAARTPKITVGTTAPGSPAVNDIWVDTN